MDGPFQHSNKCLPARSVFWLGMTFGFMLAGITCCGFAVRECGDPCSASAYLWKENWLSNQSVDRCIRFPTAPSQVQPSRSGFLLRIVLMVV